VTAPLMVDVTGWFISGLATALSPVRVGSRTPADPDGTLTWVPFVRVVRIGGPDDGITLDAPTMAFHTFATGQQSANDLGLRVRAAVYAMRGPARDGAVLAHARTLSGPSWASTENQNLAHAVLLMQARITTTS
jgi:hypothetical protein